jgi:bacillithiol biosynthesis cysteine-adding enzyme BshC
LTADGAAGLAAGGGVADGVGGAGEGEGIPGVDALPTEESLEFSIENAVLVVNWHKRTEKYRKKNHPSQQPGSKRCSSPPGAVSCFSRFERVYSHNLVHPQPMSNSLWIDFNELPAGIGGSSKLHRDYLADFPKVQPFFAHDYRSLEHFKARFAQLEHAPVNRQTLVEVLREQNRHFGAGEASLRNLELLAQPNTFAIVTGQQVGILGGPLYTVYKTITAIKLAQQLQRTFSDHNFVPVFWLEGEDHDLTEVSTVGLLNADHLPTRVEYLVGGKKQDKNLGAVGELPLNGHVQGFLDQVGAALPNSEFKQPLLEMLKSVCGEQLTFNVAFARLLNLLFEGDGLVFISSNDKRLKRICAPIFEKELREYPAVSQLIIQKSAELEGRYHAQIKTKALNLFMFHKGGRYFIEPRENDFSLRGTRHFISKEEMLRIAVEEPELLSPNVALRPICQDTLLPTLAYVAGPSEIAYYAQLKPVYEYFGIAMPIIYPRATATILEERTEKVLEKYELDLLDFLRAPDTAETKVVEIVSEIKIEEMFGEADQRVKELFNEMKFGLTYIDQTLLGPLDAARERCLSNVAVLKVKALDAQKRKHEVALRQLSKAVNALLPNGSLQEREISIIYYMDKYGLEFPRWLLGEMVIDHFKHQIIRL